MITSVALSLVLVGTSLFLLTVIPPRAATLRLLAALLPPVAVLLSLAFVVCGYVLTGRELIIERLGWSNRFPLASLGDVTVDPTGLLQFLLQEIVRQVFRPLAAAAFNLCVSQRSNSWSMSIGFTWV